MLVTIIMYSSSLFQSAYLHWSMNYINSHRLRSPALLVTVAAADTTSVALTDAAWEEKFSSRNAAKINLCVYRAVCSWRITGVGPTRSYLTARLYCRIVYPKRTMRVETQYLCVCNACLLACCLPERIQCRAYVSYRPQSVFQHDHLGTISTMRRLNGPVLHRCAIQRRDWPNARYIHTYNR